MMFSNSKTEKKTLKTWQDEHKGVNDDIEKKIEAEKKKREDDRLSAM